MSIADRLERATIIAQVELQAALRHVGDATEFERHFAKHQAALAEAKQIVATLQQEVAA